MAFWFESQKTGLDLIKWFQKELEMPLNDATKTAQQLLDLRFFHVPTKDALITSYPATFNETLFYRFYVCASPSTSVRQHFHQILSSCDL